MKVLLRLTHTRIQMFVMILLGFLVGGCAPEAAKLLTPTWTLTPEYLIDLPTSSISKTPTFVPTIPSEEPTSRPMLAEITGTITPTATFKKTEPTLTVAPRWYSRPNFPDNPPLFARVQDPAVTTMYGSLEDAVADSKSVYRFAYDTVYVLVLETQVAEGVEYARVKYDDHERWIRADALDNVTIASFSGIILDRIPISPDDSSLLALVMTDTFTSSGTSYVRGDVFLTTQSDLSGSVVQLNDTDEIAVDQIVVIPLLLERADDRYPCRRIVVDISSNMLGVYNEDCELQFATLISTGLLPGSTPLGIYRIASREIAHTFRAPPEIRKSLENYIFENVPFTMVFSGYYALHSVYWHNAFGTSTSHGCVNLSLADAQWLFNWAEERDWLFIQW